MTQQGTEQPQEGRGVHAGASARPAFLCVKNRDAKDDGVSPAFPRVTPPLGLGERSVCTLEELPLPHEPRAQDAALLAHLEAISPTFHGLEKLQEQGVFPRLSPRQSPAPERALGEQESEAEAHSPFSASLSSRALDRFAASGAAEGTAATLCCAHAHSGPPAKDPPVHAPQSTPRSAASTRNSPAPACTQAFSSSRAFEEECEEKMPEERQGPIAASAGAAENSQPPESEDLRCESSFGLTESSDHRHAARVSPDLSPAVSCESEQGRSSCCLQRTIDAPNSLSSLFFKEEPRELVGARSDREPSLASLLSPSERNALPSLLSPLALAGEGAEGHGGNQGDGGDRGDSATVCEGEDVWRVSLRRPSGRGERGAEVSMEVEMESGEATFFVEKTETSLSASRCQRTRTRCLSVSNVPLHSWISTGGASVSPRSQAADSPPSASLQLQLEGTASALPPPSCAAALAASLCASQPRDLQEEAAEPDALLHRATCLLSPRACLARCKTTEIPSFRETLLSPKAHLSPKTQLSPQTALSPKAQLSPRTVLSPQTVLSPKAQLSLQTVKDRPPTGECLSLREGSSGSNGVECVSEPFFFQEERTDSLGSRVPESSGGRSSFSTGETFRRPGWLRGDTASPRSASSRSPRNTVGSALRPRSASPWAERGRLSASEETPRTVSPLDAAPASSQSPTCNKEDGAGASVRRVSSARREAKASPCVASAPSGRPRLILLDLDNTLIPTSWIMAQWRSKHCTLGPLETVAAIRAALCEAKFFEVLDRFFASLRDERSSGQVSQVVIVTNAGTRTVENFYLQFCLPELGELCAREQVYIHSTEHVVKRLGPVPSITDEEAYREFYTTTKYHEFDFVLQRYIHGLRREHGALRRQQLAVHRRMRVARRREQTEHKPNASSAALDSRDSRPESPQSCPRPLCARTESQTVGSSPTPGASPPSPFPLSPLSTASRAKEEVSSDSETESTEETTSSSGEEQEQRRSAQPSAAFPGDWRFDLLSAGDQACEIMAACRVAHQAGDEVIRLAKLLYLNDPEDPRYLAQTPERFVAQLLDFQDALLRLLDADEETLDMQGQPEWRPTGVFSSAAVSAPSRFFLPPLHCREGHLEYVFSSSDDEEEVEEEQWREARRRRRLQKGGCGEEGTEKSTRRSRAGRSDGREAEAARSQAAEWTEEMPPPDAEEESTQATPVKRSGAATQTSLRSQDMSCEDAETPTWSASLNRQISTPATGSRQSGVGSRRQQKPFHPIASSVYYADRAYRSGRPLSQAFAAER
ncbi:hypothetical protein TGVAND_318390 [Toxoplasma gondii VAND]|uniref:Uncharacterized protein n=1 Tax=Toxoplasma gondii VAND TaxID=933077 RepID=A0A086PUQ1_TOXGO|nr:hypothetical protein TGVAND_318390 [Toxoplasma gondii VAND]